MKMISPRWSCYHFGKWRFEAVVSISQFFCGLGITYWLTPANDRQRLILELWTAFLDDDAFSYDCVTTIPDLLEKLWEHA